MKNLGQNWVLNFVAMDYNRDLTIYEHLLLLEWLGMITIDFGKSRMQK